MLRSPIFSQILPPSTPGPHKSIGYAYFRGGVSNPHSTPSPKLVSTGKPALVVEQVGYSVFYPCDEGLKRGRGIGWFPEPVREMTLGYEKFIGRKGVSWLRESSRHLVDPKARIIASPVLTMVGSTDLLAQ